MRKVRSFYTKFLVLFKLFRKVGLDSRLELGVNQISLGNRTWLGRRSYIGCYKKTAKIDIGSRVYSGDNLQLTAIDNISIQDNVLIGRNVTITDHSHGDKTNYGTSVHPSDWPLTSKGPVRIESYVWIGSNVVILGGVTIGKNSVIAANSVVRKNVMPNQIYTG